MSTVRGLALQQTAPDARNVKAFLQANAIMGETQRFRQLDRYEAHYATTQYAHLGLDWWGLPADQMETISPDMQVPIGFVQPAVQALVRSKRPTAPYHLGKAIVDRFTGLLFSDSRRPEITVENDPDTEDWLLAAMDQMRFWPKMREARTIGGSVGAVLMTVHLRNGEYALQVHNPKHVQVVWRDRRTLLPAAVLICYRHYEQEPDIDERTGEVRGYKTVTYLYRRIITEQDDTVYKPVKLEPNADLTWIVQSTAVHGLGFFPGVWIQNLPVLESEDGDPDCHGAWQNFDTMDRILAQMNKAVLLNLDPTLALKVDPKVVTAMGGSVRKGSENALYLGTDGSASYVEITGSGVEAGDRMFERLKQNTLDVCRCVLIDPSKISGSAQSAKAIEYIYAPMLEKADDFRAQYGDLGIVPILRIVTKIGQRYHKQLFIIDGRRTEFRISLPPRVAVKPLAPDAPPDAVPETEIIERKLGHGGYIRVKWGPYFSPTEQDKRAAVDTVVAAKTGSVIDAETAVKQVAPVFNIRDPIAVLHRIKAEQDQEMASLGDGGFGFEGGDNTEEPDPAAGAGGKP